MSNFNPQQIILPVAGNAGQPSGATPRQPAVIAQRKRCDADGVGLSHYILMDRKPAK